MLTLPSILNIPPKLLPIISGLENYRYFLIEGGRGSGKSHSIARVLTWIADRYDVRIVCGREVQKNIDESVHALFKDLIADNKLSFRVLEKEIRHLSSGSEIKFRGFRDVGGKTNARGMEGVDILWVDEAQQLSKRTVDDIIPTVRADNAKIFFSMNRFMRDDAVYEFCAGRPDCLHIKIDYFENPFCTISLKNEAEVCKNKSPKDYKHIWLGEPRETADDYLFNSKHLYKSLEVVAHGDLNTPQRIMGIDFAAQGNDLCVATILDRVSDQHWRVTEQISWDEPDSMVSVGKIVDLIGRYKPTSVALDVGGMGHVVHNRLEEVGMKVQRFDGSTTEGVVWPYVNLRANAYYDAKEWFEQCWLVMDKRHMDCIKELEKIKMKYRSDGKRLIQDKQTMKKEMGGSPDYADSLIIAIWCAKTFAGNNSTNMYNSNTGVSRVSKRRR